MPLLWLLAGYLSHLQSSSFSPFICMRGRTTSYIIPSYTAQYIGKRISSHLLIPRCPTRGTGRMRIHCSRSYTHLSNFIELFQWDVHWNDIEVRPKPPSWNCFISKHHTFKIPSSEAVEKFATFSLKSSMITMVHVKPACCLPKALLGSSHANLCPVGQGGMQKKPSSTLWTKDLLNHCHCWHRHSLLPHQGSSCAGGYLPYRGKS